MCCGSYSAEISLGNWQAEGNVRAHLRRSLSPPSLWVCLNSQRCPTAVSSRNFKLNEDDVTVQQLKGCIPQCENRSILWVVGTLSPSRSGCSRFSLACSLTPGMVLISIGRHRTNSEEHPLRSLEPVARALDGPLGTAMGGSPSMGLALHPFGKLCRGC